MADFAKVFRVDGRQFLCWLDFDDERDDHVLHQMIHVGGIIVDVKIRGTEAAVQGVFDRLDDETAKNFFKMGIVQRLVASQSAT